MRHRTRMIALGALGAAVAAAERTPACRHLSRRVARRVARSARYQSGKLEGLRYKLAGRGPDPEVWGPTLADRVRSVLGPLEHALDLPRVHVLAEGHDIRLHGDVDSAWQADAVVAAVRAVPGVAAVSSHLHVGLFPGDARPSQGGARPPSHALLAMLSAAHGAGVAQGEERQSVRAVLSTLLGMLPLGERRHVLAHLPEDLRVLAVPAAMAHRPIRHVDDLCAAALPLRAPGERRMIVESVLGALRDAVPEEVSDVAAVLPGELKDLWKTAIPL